MTSTAQTAIAWTESGLLPDSVIRAGIRRLNKQRLEQIHAEDVERLAEQNELFIAGMNQAEIAPVPHLANQQHYELPATFFSRVLGEHCKYSCCYWGNGAKTLNQAEADALSITCANAGIADGMDILDLGCGWGSLSLWIAARYPASTVQSVSNSRSQREWIEARARERGLSNLRVITQDMNCFDTQHRFDRIVSLEMFEHMRNYRELFHRISGWLKPDGRFFMHIFCHRNSSYEFADSGPSDWMGRHFFSGGIMPAADLPARFQEHLQLEKCDRWSGVNYAKTANAWLANMDGNKESLLPIMERTYGPDRANQWFQRWRIFFMACAELFGQFNGQEWFVSHYVFRRRETQGDRTERRSN